MEPVAHQRDEQARQLLLAYNEADCVNLQPLADAFYCRLVQASGIEDLPCDLSLTTVGIMQQGEWVNLNLVESFGGSTRRERQPRRLGARDAAAFDGLLGGGGEPFGDVMWPHPFSYRDGPRTVR